MMLEDFRVTCDPADEDFWAGTVEGMTDLWPMHLHNALTALARALVEADRRLGDVDARAVIDLAERRRKDSYAKRAGSREMRATTPLLARVMAGLPDAGLKRYELLELVHSHVTGRPERDLPEGMGAEGFLDHLVHRGLLLEGKDCRYTCPVPSFRRYLIGNGGPDPDGGRTDSGDGRREGGVRFPSWAP